MTQTYDDDPLQEWPAISSRPVRRAWIGRVVAMLVVLALVVAAVVAVVHRRGAAQPAAERFVTATATVGSVSQVLSATGTVAKTNQESLRFPVAGTVATVEVGLGDPVTQGQTIATLETTGLQFAVDTAQAAYDQAVVVLEQAQKAADDAVAAADSSASAPGTSGGGGGGPGAGQMSGLQVAVAQAQQAVGRAQQDLTGALATQRLACLLVPGMGDSPTSTGTPGTTATGGSRPGSTPTATPTTRPTTTPTTRPTTTPSATATTSPSPGTTTVAPARLEACAQAMAATRQAQSALTAAQQSLTQATTAFAQAVTELQASVAATAAAAAAKASAASANTGNFGGAGGQGGGGGGIQSRLQDAKNAVVTAAGALAKAQSNLAAATMVSPIDGVVATMPFAAGDAVSATTALVVVGPGAITVTIAVAAVNIGLVEQGQAATITQAGKSVAGTVTTKALLPGTSGFSVVVTSSDPKADAFLPGVAATVSISVLTSTNVVVVPISAVVRDAPGSTHGTVVALGLDGTPTSVAVEIGAVGPTQVAIVSGLGAGQSVVIADTTVALPSSGGLNLGALRSTVRRAG